jgi:hypothetical protein
MTFLEAALNNHNTKMRNVEIRKASLLQGGLLIKKKLFGKRLLS